MNEKCRIAVIGVGQRGYYYVQLLQAHPQVEIAALCDASVFQPRRLRGPLRESAQTGPESGFQIGITQTEKGPVPFMVREYKAKIYTAPYPKGSYWTVSIVKRDMLPENEEVQLKKQPFVCDEMWAELCKREKEEAKENARKAAEEKAKKEAETKARKAAEEKAKMETEAKVEDNGRSGETPVRLRRTETGLFRILCKSFFSETA